MKAIGEICRANKTFFHADAVQSFGKVKLDVDEMGIDLMSISGHKIYGPKGIGALFIRRKPRVRLTPQMSGGGQEKGLRSGTLSPSLCVGLGEAARLAMLEMDDDRRHVTNLRDRFLNGLSSKNIHLNGDMRQRYEGNLNLCITDDNN